jgi:hypothetical protein
VYQGSQLQNKPTAAVAPVLLLTDNFNGGEKTQGSGTEESMLSVPLLVTNTYELQGILSLKCI